MKLDNSVKPYTMQNKANEYESMYINKYVKKVS